jgi:pyruvate formate lyase activating enzyme
VGPAPNTSTKSSKALGTIGVLWREEPGAKVVCDLCAHRCRILPGRAGVCQVRVNDGGVLKTLVLNRLISMRADPIEKKPLFHFLPGTRSLSIATVGCNFRCRYCQNWQISQYLREFGGVPGDLTAPSAVVNAALRSGCSTLAYTYTEPTIFFETCEAVGIAGREQGLRNIFVTNGYLTPEAVRRAGSFLDAANVDLKGFDDARYRKTCGATLKGVLEGLSALLEAGMWVEVTTLIVPGFNDSPDELRALSKHLAGLSPHLPWHISRFHPDYKMNQGEPTSIRALRDAYDIGREAGLHHVYLGNIPGRPEENTYCPNCETMVIGRQGFFLAGNNMRDGRCGSCGTPISGVWH